MLYVMLADVLRALPLLLGEGPLCKATQEVSVVLFRGKRKRWGRTLHGGDGVARPLEVVLREARALEHGRALDGLELDVVVRATGDGDGKQ